MPAKNRRLLLKTAAGNPLFQPISAESTEFTPDSGDWALAAVNPERLTGGA